MNFDSENWDEEVNAQEKDIIRKLGRVDISPQQKRLGRGRGIGRGALFAANYNNNNLLPGSSNSSAANANFYGDKGGSEETANDSLLNKMLAKRFQLLHSPEDTLQLLQSDPSSPLFSVKSFETLNLKPELQKGVFAMGFNAPSRIQEAALPLLLRNPPENLIAQSQSGTGKTAAFVLTMLSRVNSDLKYCQALCLAPTLELAKQIGVVAKDMGKFLTDIGVCLAVRGARLPRGQECEDQIVIGTPGTVLDWCTKFRHIDLKKVIVFVLDEADIMIATQGHRDQSIRIQQSLNSSTCQMLLFSATYDDEVISFAHSVIPKPSNTIRLKKEELTLDNIRQYYVRVSSEKEKYDVLCNIYGALSIGQAIIFCRTRRTAGWLAGEMTNDGHSVGLLTGELDVEQRAAVIARFRSGSEKVMITTNVSARGIDIEQVTIVVNFDPPTLEDGNTPDFETYIHRIGRTGRFGKQGIAINMVDSDRVMNMIEQFAKYYNKEIIALDGQDLDEIEKIQN